MAWRPLVATGIARLFGAPLRVALPLDGALGQIGEFSFGLPGLAVSLGVVLAAERPLRLAATALASAGLLVVAALRVGVGQGAALAAVTRSTDAGSTVTPP